MQLAPIQAGHSARHPTARQQMLVQVKFMGLPLQEEPEVVHPFSRFIFRVIGRLVAARP